ncbi:MAG: ribosome assembly cofactor RimP [Treponema sp.]|jgi:ribosome maturation factor RimP|nr:ribosome assembly cofactor RimP [Treponema sp.]
MLYRESRDEKSRNDGLIDSLEPVIRGMGVSLVELTVNHRKARGGNSGTVQVRAVIYRDSNTGLEDCSRVHRAILPRLELAFDGKDIYLEVSSPGINRIIKDGSEFAHYTGRCVRCYRTDISDWTAGTLAAVDESKIVLRTEDGEIELPYEVIAKARLG